MGFGFSVMNNFFMNCGLHVHMFFQGLFHLGVELLCYGVCIFSVWLDASIYFPKWLYQLPMVYKWTYCHILSNIWFVHSFKIFVNWWLCNFIMAFNVQFSDS